LTVRAIDGDLVDPHTVTNGPCEEEFSEELDYDPGRVDQDARRNHKQRQ
jgi:hypothetical protein